MVTSLTLSSIFFSECPIKSYDIVVYYGNSAVITPTFSVTWSFRNKFRMLMYADHMLVVKKHVLNVNIKNSGAAQAFC